MSRSIVSPTFLKQKARQIKKASSLSQSQALDEASREFGFTNYKNYLNVLEANNNQSMASKVALLKNISKEKDTSKKEGLAISFLQNFKVLFHEQLDILKLFKKPDSIQDVCEKSCLMKDEIQSYLLNDFSTDDGKAEIHFRQPHFIAKAISLSDLTYEMDGDTLIVYGIYNLKTEFEFEIDEDDPIGKDEHFKDRKLFGTFEVEIDSNKNISIINSDIGEEFDGSFEVASFR